MFRIFAIHFSYSDDCQGDIFLRFYFYFVKDHIEIH